MTASHIAAVVLAAGLSTRMGKPKLLLPWGNSTVIGTVLNVLHQKEIDRIVVVVGAYQELIERAVRAASENVRVVFNPGYGNGEMSDSIKIGIRNLKGVEGALIVLADHPQISSSLVLRLCTAFQSNLGDIIVPSYNMRRGHPWLVGQKYWDEMMNLSSTFTMRDFLNLHSNSIHYVVVESDETMADIDTPEDYNKALKKIP